MLNQARDEDGQEPAGDSPLRLCVVTRAQCSPDDLIRFAQAPDGTIVPDLARRLPGRGVWVSATRACVSEAVNTKAFSRSLKRQAKTDPALADLVERLLTKRVLEAISLSNKAGQVVFGFTKVDALVAGGQAIALLHGREAAADGRQKLDRKFQAIMADKDQPAVILDGLATQELSLAIGRENVVHAALAEGGASRRVIKEAERLLRYRSGTGISRDEKSPGLSSGRDG